MSRESPATETRHPKTEGERLMYGLLSAAHALEDRLERALAPVGLSMSKLSVLTQLVESDQPVSLSELASRLSCVRSNMTQLVDRLEADGLVERVDDPSDRRSVLAAITSLGIARQHAGDAEVQRVKEGFVGALPIDDRDALDRLLGALTPRA